MSKEWRAVAWYSHEKTSIVTGDPGDWNSVQLISECHTTENDARVMAASRELLKALIVAREFIGSDRNTFADCCSGPDKDVNEDDAEVLSYYDSALSQIDSAIAKATGSAT